MCFRKIDGAPSHSLQKCSLNSNMNSFYLLRHLLGVKCLQQSLPWGFVCFYLKLRVNRYIYSTVFEQLAPILCNQLPTKMTKMTTPRARIKQAKQTCNTTCPNSIRSCLNWNCLNWNCQTWRFVSKSKQTTDQLIVFSSILSWRWEGVNSWHQCKKNAGSMSVKAWRRETWSIILSLCDACLCLRPPHWL